MKKDTDRWAFIQKQSRPPLTIAQANNIKALLKGSLKIGMEFELNLPKNIGSCDGSNQACGCVSVFLTDKKTECYSECPKQGNCEIEKQHGCAGVYCVEFEAPCAACSKFDRGCGNCSKLKDPLKEPEIVRQTISNLLKPSQFLGSLGENGILDVVKDGSLVGGGVEVTTVGRKVNFDRFHQMCQTVISTALPHKVFIDERCSTHFHILSGYLNAINYNNQPGRKHYGLPSAFGKRELKELEEPIPEIVLANFHQLWRRYQNAIIWLTSTGSKDRTLTRWIKFRRSMLRYSAVRQKMGTLITEMAGSQNNNNRYMMVNYVPMKFDADGNISTLHFEIRAPDGTLSPLAATSFACLFYALLLKSVEISCHGIVESGNKPYMDLAKQIEQVLCNNEGSYDGPRTSDTSNLGPFIGELQQQAVELIRLTKSVLIDLPPAYEILMSLAEMPISMRLCRGESWEDIEKNLAAISSYEFTSLDSQLIKVMDLGLISECQSIEEWVQVVSEDLGHERGDVKSFVESMLEGGKAFWNSSSGAVVRR